MILIRAELNFTVVVLSRIISLRDLIRKEQMRTSQVEVIRQELIKAEQSGFSSRSPEDIVNEVIARKQTNGEV